MGFFLDLGWEVEKFDSSGIRGCLYFGMGLQVEKKEFPPHLLLYYPLMYFGAEGNTKKERICNS